ncbi:hypothetical protein VISI1226_09659 [Vibrio sinaloensis DSM 21326]|uniref:Uncharacterized protein n=1 Tax=Vibrio sinaloensis DSM 21326 TaxID=945550 RepID=E8M980_PHOS4|nr:hypothetical protein VISI1226_09659 [Vibrio sinaloensis DSM 21326]MDN3685616.1 hypothetical protein [Vibrio sinaloensis]
MRLIPQCITESINLENDSNSDMTGVVHLYIVGNRVLFKFGRVAR